MGGTMGEVENLVSRTKKFTLRVIRLYSSLPKQTLAQVLGEQVLRPGTSVGANLIATERLYLLQYECNQLLSIFVTIIKNKKRNS